MTLFISSFTNGLFQTSKTLNYLDSPIITPFFALFVAVWVYMRHYLNLHILWAVLTEFRTVGPFEVDWEAEQYKFWVSQYITFALLGSLQAINLFWLYLIIRIAKTYVFSNALQDERSDNEEEDEIEESSPAIGDGNGVPIPTLLVNGHASKENTDLIGNGSSTGLTNGNSNGAATKRK